MDKAKDNGSARAKRSFIREVMSGSVLTERVILKNLWYIIFLAFLGAFYIANRFHAESLVRRTSKLQVEVGELRAEALSLSAALNFSSKQSEVIRRVRERGLGLEELVEPPYMLVVKKRDR